MSLIHYGTHKDIEPPSVRRALSVIFGGYIKHRSSEDHVCPKCGAPLPKLRMNSGFIGIRNGKTHAKMSISCDDCSAMHTAKLSGNKAVHVFMSLQGTDKIKKRIAAEIKRLQETSRARAKFSALDIVDYPKTAYGKEMTGN